MSRRAFSIVELVIAIFLIILVASIFVPLNIANIKQAERISKWRNVFDESRYSFELLRAQNPNLIKTVRLSKSNDSNDTFELIKNYLDIDAAKSTPAYFKHYRYKYMNGRRVKPNSKFYVKDFASLQSGVIIGFRLNENRLMYEGAPFGILLFDINGLEKPNRIGKDIFGVNIYRNSIKPFGEGHQVSAMRANCSPIGTGVMCSKFYLIGGKF